MSIFNNILGLNIGRLYESMNMMFMIGDGFFLIRCFEFFLNVIL